MSLSGKIFLLAVGLFIFLYTLSFFIYFLRIGSNYFSKSQVIFHSVLIWIVPIFWIIRLKKIILAKRGTPQPNYGGIDNYGSDPFFSFFHYSSQNTGEQHSHHFDADDSYHSDSDSTGSDTDD